MPRFRPPLLRKAKAASSPRRPKPHGTHAPRGVGRQPAFGLTCNHTRERSRCLQPRFSDRNATFLGQAFFVPRLPTRGDAGFVAWLSRAARCRQSVRRSSGEPRYGKGTFGACHALRRWFRAAVRVVSRRDIGQLYAGGAQPRNTRRSGNHRIHVPKRNAPRQGAREWSAARPRRPTKSKCEAPIPPPTRIPKKAA